LADDVAEREFSLKYEKTPVKTHLTHVNSLKRMVCREFEEMGFRTSYTNAPFDIVASCEDLVFSVVSNDWRRLGDKLSVLEDVADMLDGYGVCISCRRIKSNVSVLSPRELAEIKSPRELFKLLSD